MSLMKILLIFSIVSTIVYMMYVMRSDVQDLFSAYMTKPTPQKRTVVSIQCGSEKLDEDTVKSLLSQSVRVHEISVETTNMDISDDLKKVITIHKPRTLEIRELDSDTIIIKVENGIQYPYDYIEKEILKYGS